MGFEDSGELLSIVVPARDEEASIGAVLDEIQPMRSELGCDSEVIVVDDGSRDATAERAAAHQGVRLLRNPISLGYGASILRAVSAARGSLIAITDADGTYPVSEVPRLLAMIRSGVDHAIGCRTGLAMRRLRLVRAIYRHLCGYVVGTEVPDANSGLRICRRAIIEELRGDLCFGFSLTTSLTLASLMRGYVVAFADIPYRRRVGRSHVRFRDVLRTAQYLVQLIAVYNPIKLFVPLIAASLGTAVIAAVVAAAGVWNGGFLAAVVMLATALLLVGLGALTYVVSRVGRGSPPPVPPAPDRHAGAEP
jgi:glycosyltransferase involved in cell wall biosynthesis